MVKKRGQLVKALRRRIKNKKTLNWNNNSQLQSQIDVLLEKNNLVHKNIEESSVNQPENIFKDLVTFSSKTVTKPFKTISNSSLQRANKQKNINIFHIDTYSTWQQNIPPTQQPNEVLHKLNENNLVPALHNDAKRLSLRPRINTKVLEPLFQRKMSKKYYEGYEKILPNSFIVEYQTDKLGRG